MAVNSSMTPPNGKLFFAWCAICFSTCVFIAGVEKVFNPSVLPWTLPPDKERELINKEVSLTTDIARILPQGERGFLLYKNI